jgi:hypothetical protein
MMFSSTLHGVVTATLRIMNKLMREANNRSQLVIMQRQEPVIAPAFCRAIPL